jgi:hypothetical protein
MTRLALLALLALVVSTLACGGASSGATADEPATTSGAATTTNGASDTTGHDDGANGASETTGDDDGATTAAVASTPPLSSVPECDAYLRLYQRCEATLAPSIAAGDRRDFVHERGWLEYMSTTPEVAAMPDACRDMTRELQAACP